MSQLAHINSIASQWLRDLKSHTSTNLNSSPNYYLAHPESLITSSSPSRLLLGSGHQILQPIFQAIQSALHEVLFVTCFWAKSASQADLAQALRELSARAVAEGRCVRVRICYSSDSIVQKLTHTASLDGVQHPPKVWASKFGLPGAAELRGLDVTVHSVFVQPLSVMHSKFVIVDRQVLFMPSCNVSWEEWLEGSVEMSGDVVQQALLFWESFWGRDEVLPGLSSQTRESVGSIPSSTHPLVGTDLSLTNTPTAGTRKTLLTQTFSHVGTITTLLLPSPHHRNPSFKPLPWTKPPPSRPSPLNIFLLTIFNTATRSIYIQSPNVNSPPVIAALLSALDRGISVKIVTNTMMMVTEQLVTAGRLTECVLGDLHRKWRQKRQQYSDLRDPEGAQQVGALEILYYTSQAYDPQSLVKSHLKLTVVDDEIVVLGSGNMDRASWYTSQELGVAFFSREMAVDVMDGVGRSLRGRLQRYDV